MRLILWTKDKVVQAELNRVEDVNGRKTFNAIFCFNISLDLPNAATFFQKFRLASLRSSPQLLLGAAAYGAELNAPKTPPGRKYLPKEVRMRVFYSYGEKNANLSSKLSNNYENTKLEEEKWKKEEASNPQGVNQRRKKQIEAYADRRRMSFDTCS
ncbi:hypothetical protein K1719_046151 [Acacia pycnantha]|nr:hypothetical protein K1719_046151 [Acacia pycnantha]